MFDDFQPRHILPLLLATTITYGGTYPFVHGGEAAILKFGFPQKIASVKATHPVITAYSSRATSFGLALWGMYLGGHYQAMDILLASLGWCGLVDAWVCYKDGAPGSVLFRGLSTGAISLWGLLGMTAGRSS